MKNTTSITGAQPALLFIPDISGFTRFVTEVEISHSQHIIEELLETLIEANDIGLQVSEIEGDAILFYRFGPAPSAKELFGQVQNMFVRFHAHLRKYDTHRICQCGACSTASQLTLKFVAHYGQITLNNVKQYQKLFGKEVIVAHRLLKNSIEHHEYAMFTYPLTQACPQWAAGGSESVWSPVQHGNDEYDSGPVDYCYLPLAPLMHQVPEPVTEDFSIPGLKALVLSDSTVVQAPLDLVFSVLSDLSWREKWIVGVDHIHGLNHKITQVGSSHQCIVDGPLQFTHDFQATPGRVTFSETYSTKKICKVYTLSHAGDGLTQVEVHIFIKKNFLVEAFFNLFLKNKYRTLTRQTFANLKNYCEGLVERGEEHSYRIVLGEAVPV